MASTRRRPHKRQPIFNREERRAWLIVVALTLTVSSIGYVMYKRSQRPLPKAPEMLPIDSDPNSSSPSLVPRAGLEVQTVIERSDRTRRILLRLGGGEAILTLGPSDPTSGSKGEGTLVAESSEKGAPFLAAFGRWFNEEPAPARSTPTPLKALKVEYVRLGASTSRAPEAMRLTLIGTRRRAEVFFNLFPDGRRATFLERGRGETRASLLAALAEALRDGPKPPRTSVNDPNMISDLPFAKSVHSLSTSPVLGAACGEHTIFAAVRDGWNSKLVVIDPSSAKATRTITTFEGVLEGLAGSPDGRQVAVLVVRTSNPDQIQPEDVRELRLIDVDSGTPIMISNVDEAFRGTALPIWSKQTFALEGRMPTTTPGDRITRVYSSKFGEKTLSLLGETEGRLRLRPLRFEGDQVVLATWENQPRPHRGTYLWTAGSAPIAKEPIPFASPDGRFSFTLDEDKIVAKDGRAFVSTDVDDKLAIRRLDGAPPIWVGKHVLALRSDYTLAFDLETMHVQPLVTDSDSALACVTSDGRKAVLVAIDGTAMVADLPADP